MSKLFDAYTNFLKGVNVYNAITDKSGITTHFKDNYFTSVGLSLRQTYHCLEKYDNYIVQIKHNIIVMFSTDPNYYQYHTIPIEKLWFYVYYVNDTHYTREQFDITFEKFRIEIL